MHIEIKKKIKQSWTTNNQTTYLCIVASSLPIFKNLEDLSISLFPSIKNFIEDFAYQISISSLQE